jgi:hypothetical protein
MDFFADNQIITVFAVILIAVVMWFVLRFALRLTLRIFRLGCLAIFIIAGLVITFNWIL